MVKHFYFFMVMFLFFASEATRDELKNMQCVACARVLDENIVTYWNKSYHQDCWKLLKMTHKKEGSFCSIFNIASTLSFGASLSCFYFILRGDDKELNYFDNTIFYGLIIASPLFFGCSDDWATDELALKRYGKLTTYDAFSNRGQEIYWGGFDPYVLRGPSHCPECKEGLKQGSKLITIKMTQPKPYVWTQSGVYHETCIQKGLTRRYERGLKNDYNALWWAYKRAKCRDALNWLFPTRLHVPLRIFNSGFILLASLGLLTKYRWIPDDAKNFGRTFLGLTTGCMATLSYALYKL